MNEEAPRFIVSSLHVLPSPALRHPPLPNQRNATTPEASKNDDAASNVDLPKSTGPLDGLRRFSRDGMDGVFMGAAGVPVRYRL